MKLSILDGHKNKVGTVEGANWKDIFKALPEQYQVSGYVLVRESE